MDSDVQKAVDLWLDDNNCRYGGGSTTIGRTITSGTATPPQGLSLPPSPYFLPSAAENQEGHRHHTQGDDITRVMRKVDEFLNYSPNSNESPGVDTGWYSGRPEVLPHFSGLGVNRDGMIDREEWQAYQMDIATSLQSAHAADLTSAQNGHQAPPQAVQRRSTWSGGSDPLMAVLAAAEDRERSYIEAERRQIEQLMQDANKRLHELREVESVQENLEIERQKVKDMFKNQQSLEAQLRAVQKQAKEAIAARDEAAQVRTKAKQKSDRDTEKVLRFTAEIEALKESQKEELAEVQHARDKAVALRTVAEKEVETFKGDYSKLQADMGALMEAWDAKQRTLESSARNNSSEATQTVASLQKEVRQLSQQHVKDMEELARERRIKATLAAQLDEVSVHRYGWPKDPAAPPQLPQAPSPSDPSSAAEPPPSPDPGCDRVLTNPEKKWVKCLFRSVDHNGSGLVDFCEFSKLIRLFAPNEADDKALLQTFKKCGAKNDALELHNFEVWCASTLGLGLTEVAFIDGMKELTTIAQEQLSGPVS